MWQWGIKPPVDLQGQYPTQWAHRCSLETADLREANEKAGTLQAQWLQRFAEQRRELNPQLVEKVTVDLAQMLAQRVTTALLAADEKLRTAPGAAKLLLSTLRVAVPSKLTIGPAPLPPWADAPTDPLHGLSDELAAELALLNVAMDAEAARHWALQRITTIFPMAQAEGRKLGVEFDATTPGALNALRECLKAYRRARHDAHLRDLGEIIETPTAPRLGTAAAPNGPQFLRDVLPAWTASKARKPQTIRAATLALEHYEKSTGNPKMTALTRAQGVEFRAYLRGLGVTDKTTRDRLDYVKGLLNFAARDLELIPRNPWSGLSVEYRTTNPRAPWSQEQLAKLCALPLFTSYALPKQAKAGQDAAYWIPLLGMFTGARIGELAQLRVQDVQTVDGVPVLRITDEAEGATVKSAAGHRLVPVHAELQRLGFLEYVEVIKARGAVALWPLLPVLQGKPGHYASAAFTKLRDLGDGKAKLPDFHSLRHTVRSKLASAEVAEPVIDALIGHEVKGSTGARTYTKRTTADLARAIGRLSYPDLNPPRVYSAPAWKPSSAKRA